MPKTTKTEIYRVPAQIKAMMVQATGVSLFMAMFVLMLAWIAIPRDPSLWPVLLLLLALSCGASLFFWRALPDCDAHIEVNDDAISQHWPHKSSVTLVWSQINRVKNNPIMQRLELHSTTMAVKVTVEHQIENFEELRDFIDSKLPQTSRRA